MKGNLLRIITLLGVLTIVLVQSVWLLNTYSLMKNEFSITATNVLEKAIEKEAFVMLNELPRGAMVDGKPVEEKNNIPEHIYLLESLAKSGIYISMEEVHKTYGGLLENTSQNNKFKLYKIKKDNDSIFDVAGEIASSSYTVKTAPIPIRSDSSLFIQAEFSNPWELFFSRMGLLLISTAIMMIFVIGCIIYQIRIIANQNKIAQAREDFSYAMIHDMKTPLSSIMMCANFLHSGRLDGKPDLKEQYFKIIDSEADHLLKLADKVLTISKLESKKLEMELDKVELKPILDNLIKNFSTKSAKPIAFVLNLQEEHIYADEEFIKEVFSNLIDNAIKYSKESVEMQITSENDGNYSILRFHDNGIGISEKDQKTIFNKFERASAVKRTRSGGPSGFGLGLSYVSQVIEAHHGKILINSIEGEFSEFIIYIPLVIKNL